MKKWSVFECIGGSRKGEKMRKIIVVCRQYSLRFERRMLGNCEIKLCHMSACAFITSVM
jgi:hypothetical protein